MKKSPMNEGDKSTPQKFSSKLKSFAQKLTPGRDRKGSNAQKRRQSSEEFPKFDPSAIDRQPFRDCSTLYHDCDEFLKISEKTIEFTKKSTGEKPSKVSSKINKWRAKRKGNSLFQMYEAIQARIEKAGSRLQDVSDHSVRSSSTHVSQALYILTRLQACINYNTVEIEEARPLLDAGSAYLADLKTTEQSLQSMLRFYDSLTDMKKNQGQPYIPWALRVAAEAQKKTNEEKATKAGGGNGKDMDEGILLDRNMIMKRLKKVRKVLVVVERVMITNTAKYRSMSVNLDSLKRAQAAMLKLLENFRCKSISQATVKAFKEAMKAYNETSASAGAGAAATGTSADTDSSTADPVSSSEEGLFSALNQQNSSATRHQHLLHELSSSGKDSLKRSSNNLVAFAEDGSGTSAGDGDREEEDSMTNGFSIDDDDAVVDRSLASSGSSGSIELDSPNKKFGSPNTMAVTEAHSDAVVGGGSNDNSMNDTTNGKLPADDSSPPAAGTVVPAAHDDDGADDDVAKEGTAQAKGETQEKQEKQLRQTSEGNRVRLGSASSVISAGTSVERDSVLSSNSYCALDHPHRATAGSSSSSSSSSNMSVTMLAEEFSVTAQKLAETEDHEEDRVVIEYAFQKLRYSDLSIPEEFDHTQCMDCSCVADMANECCMLLAASKIRGKECAEHVIKLKQYRDRIRSDADLLESLDWGGAHSMHTA